jgi:hypothetical protein
LQACRPIFEELRERFSDLESVDISDSGVQLSKYGADMCLSGSSYSLTLRPARGRDARWQSVEGRAEPGAELRRRHSRRFGSAKAVIDVSIWDGADLSPRIVPALRRAASECAQLLTR